MKKTILTITIFLIFLNIIILVNALNLYEVYPDPVISESNGEYINLFSNKTENISNYFISTPSGNITLPNIIIPKNFYYLIGKENFLKDNQTWPKPDFETKMTLRNSNGYVELYKKNVFLSNLSLNSSVSNFSVDKISWVNSKEGMAITKTDFKEANPKNIETSFSNETILVNITYINISFSYDFNENLIYYPMKENYVYFNFNTFCKNKTKIEWFGKIDEFEKKGNYTSMRKLTNKLDPGEYFINVSYCGINKKIKFKIFPVIAIENNNSEIQCNFNEIKNICVSNGILKNIGNVPIRLKIIKEGINNNIKIYFNNHNVNSTIFYDEVLKNNEELYYKIKIDGNYTTENNFFKIKIEGVNK